ncbi:hypothetical protein HGRIS_004999 [Hohenbuehelia grisea]|uniref:Uncharacterized protein n=1 Tax=Hohenbuehelia grisea TaxID=104357 RepID=A0ABR3JDP3_9AGAR
MLPPNRRPRSHMRSSSMTATFPTYDEQAFEDYHQASTSTAKAASRIVSSVKRSLGTSVQRKQRDTTQSQSASASPSREDFRFHDPAATPSSSPPTLDQIAMGLHLSRTPHLRTVNVGGKARSQFNFSPYAAYAPSAPTPSVAGSRSSSAARRPRRFSTQQDRANIPIAAIPLLPRSSTAPQSVPKIALGKPKPPRPRPVSLPPSPIRSSLKKTPTQSSEESSIPTSPGLSMGSTASASTESSINSVFAPSKSRSLLTVSFKTRMAKLLGGLKGSDTSDSASLLPADGASLSSRRNSSDGHPAKKAVRFIADSEEVTAVP